jgi:hypothetical protein
MMYVHSVSVEHDVAYRTRTKLELIVYASGPETVRLFEEIQKRMPTSVTKVASDELTAALVELLLNQLEPQTRVAMLDSLSAKFLL